MHEIFMKKAIIEAFKAYKKGDVPVGCVIVKNNKIISKGYNKKEKKYNSIKHAEIIAISKACKKLKKWRLNDCVLYTTMEPCLMCTGAIVQSRINKVYYSVQNKTFGYLDKFNENNKNKITVTKGLFKKEVEQMLKEFFEEKRK